MILNEKKYFLLKLFLRPYIWVLFQVELLRNPQSYFFFRTHKPLIEPGTICHLIFRTVKYIKLGHLTWIFKSGREGGGAWWCLYRYIKLLSPKKDRGDISYFYISFLTCFLNFTGKIDLDQRYQKRYLSLYHFFYIFITNPSRPLFPHFTPIIILFFPFSSQIPKSLLNSL